MLNQQQANTGPWAEELDRQATQFIEDCAFAKVVETPSGSAILVQGKVISVAGPDSWGYASLLVKALRQGGVSGRAGA